MRWLRYLWRQMRMNMRTPDDDWNVPVTDESPLEPAGISTPMTVRCEECNAHVNAWLRTAHEKGDLVQCGVDEKHWWVRLPEERHHG